MAIIFLSLEFPQIKRRELESKCSNALIIKSSVILLSQWYDSGNELREIELSKAICANINNSHVDHVYFLQSKSLNLYSILVKHCNITKDYYDSKVTILIRDKNEDENENENMEIKWKQKNSMEKNGRLTIGQVFKFINENLIGHRIILHNLDIHFDDTLKFLKTDRHLSHYHYYFLSRYEGMIDENDENKSIECNQKTYIGSHDSFVFVAPVPKPLTLLSISLGTPGFEARLIWELWQHGIWVTNPCFTIKSWHLHHSNHRTDRKSIIALNTKGRSKVARPCKLGEFDPII